MVCLIVTEVGGSSPLARGLLTDGEGGTVVGRIIPACPRMSPHAQGLHPEPDRVVHVHGIISARAGFTTAISRRPATSWDHPRSRGVYRQSMITAGAPAGSSPLARGLPQVHVDIERALGIIPARAGFTPSSGGVPRRTGDHPRSRGVYHMRFSFQRVVLGSSPLARGLPAPRRRRHRARGIIPARAGFTGGRGRLPVGHRDHPRSRGVYPLADRMTFSTPGSSPLARGLLRRLLSHRRRRWIIPARAGFTGRNDRRRRGLQDHPRSRGVYRVLFRGLSSKSGSSPLARGLPFPNDWTLSRVLDHPRSRGVYPA